MAQNLPAGLFQTGSKVLMKSGLPRLHRRPNEATGWVQFRECVCVST